MCVQYWPPNKEKDETYGDISVGIVQEEELANFHIRTFRLYKTEKDVSEKYKTEKDLILESLRKLSERL